VFGAGGEALGGSVSTDVLATYLFQVGLPRKTLTCGRWVGGGWGGGGGGRTVGARWEEVGGTVGYQAL